MLWGKHSAMTLQNATKSRLLWNLKVRTWTTALNMQLPSPVILNNWKRVAGGLKGRMLAKAAAPGLVGTAPLAGPAE
jgi:hypothetical protein